MKENTLPKGWTQTTIKNVLDFVLGGDWGKDPLKFEDKDYTEVLCIRGSEIKHWQENKGSTAVRRLIKDASLQKRKLQLGDILIEISGGGPDQPVGRTVYIDEQALAYEPDVVKVCTNFLRLLRFNESLNSKFINKFFDYFYLSGRITKYQGGSNNLRNLKFKEFETIKLPIPPRPEQDRIVAKVDALMGQVSVMQESLQRIPQLLKDCRQQVLTQAVTGKLIGKKEFTTLGKLEINIKTGPFGSALHKSEYIDNGIPIINPSHIKKGKIIPNQSITVTNEKAKELERWLLQPNDIILGRRGEMGRCALYTSQSPPMLCGTGSLVLKGNEKVNPKFLDFYLRSSFCISYLENNSVGSTMINLNQKILKSLPFPDLNYDEQTKSIEHLSKLFSKADAIQQHYEALKQKIDTLPQAILHKAFKGELVEQLESDGSAEELLREIEGLKEKSKDKKIKTREKYKKGNMLRQVAESKTKYGIK